MNQLFKKITSEIKTKDLWLLTNIVNEYNDTDYQKYIEYDQNTYNKKILYKNKKIELVLICWKKGQISEIHDHAKHGCILKLLNGYIKETRYTPNLTNESITYIRSNDTSYIDDLHGYHKIEALQDSVSLHIYSPPNHVTKTYSSSVVIS